MIRQKKNIFVGLELLDFVVDFYYFEFICNNRNNFMTMLFELSAIGNNVKIGFELEKKGVRFYGEILISFRSVRHD